MLIGGEILMTALQLHLTLVLLVAIPFLGAPRSKGLWLGLLLKQNIEQWLLLHPRLCGYKTYWVNCILICFGLPFYYVITFVPHICVLIQFCIPEWNIYHSIIILRGSKFNKAKYVFLIFPPMTRLQIYWQSLFLRPSSKILESRCKFQMELNFLLRRCNTASWDWN